MYVGICKHACERKYLSQRHNQLEINEGIILQGFLLYINRSFDQFSLHFSESFLK